MSINNSLFPVPPLEEQQNIINFLQSLSIRIQDIIAKTQTQINLLEEYRTALISNVVTGKIDVRDEVKG